jgi:hypothetical protein
VAVGRGNPRKSSELGPVMSPHSAYSFTPHILCICMNKAQPYPALFRALRPKTVLRAAQARAGVAKAVAANFQEMISASVRVIPRPKIF